TMLPCVALLLMGLPVCTVAGDSEQELDLSTEAKPWVIVTLEGNLIPGIQLQLQEVKNGKASQFFGLMGKRVGGYHLERMVQGLLEPLVGGKGIMGKWPDALLPSDSAGSHKS
uniref:Tachykinin-4 n=1 Tax=Castor canadensis TaxID=51338 RepID=A0A8C0VZ76_CASCN